MSPKCKSYKDVLAAPGSELFAALVEGDHKKAERVYKECRDREKALGAGRKETSDDTAA